MVPMKKKLLIEGWRSISHSYAVVNQWQALALRKRPDFDLFFRDVSFYNPQWSAVNGLFRPEDENYINNLQNCDSTGCDAVLRIAFPLDFSNRTGKKTIVFGTSEFKTLPPNFFSNYGDFLSAIRDPDVKIMTPSRWSAEGFFRKGCLPDQVRVVPHGVDTATFCPPKVAQSALKASLGLYGFVFMNIGGMMHNKGIDLLLKAFAVVVAKHPETCLLLKGADGLYASGSMLRKQLDELTIADRDRILKRCVYHGDFLSMADMASLYQLADVYVSPYRAEGFNLPVLEAAASGLPVICTNGGSTDDFVTDTFARKINSKLVTATFDGEVGDMLAPDLDHLIHLMLTLVEDDGWRNNAAAEAVSHVQQNFTWDIVVDKFVTEFFS